MSVIFVPAGLEGLAHKQMTLYSAVAHNEQEQTIIGNTRRYFTHTRDIEYIDTKCSQYIPPAEDYTFATSVIGPAFIKSNGIKIILLNPSGKDNMKHSTYMDAGIHVISDSGGFQLYSGVKEFIDPVKLAHKYNRICTIGMDLDVPILNGIDRDHVIALGKLHRLNHLTMKEHCSKRVNLCMISHGVTIDDRQLYYDTVQRENVEYIAIAGLRKAFYSGSDYPQYLTEHLLHLISNYPHTKYIHGLGTTSYQAFFVYSVLDYYKLVNAIGGDSVTYILNAASGQYFRMLQQTGYVHPEQYVESVPACSCSICKTTMDNRLFKGQIAWAHNLLGTWERVKFIQNLTNEYLSGNVKLNEFIAILDIGLTKQQVLETVEYVQQFMSKGFHKRNTNKKSLFGKTHRHIDAKLNADYTKVIQRYEAYYKKRIM